MTRDKPPAADACVKATPPAAMILEVEAFAGALPPNARLIGIDVGTKTLGLALSDLSRTIASGLETIRRTKFKADAARRGGDGRSLRELRNDCRALRRVEPGQSPLEPCTRDAEYAHRGPEEPRVTCYTAHDERVVVVHEPACRALPRLLAYRIPVLSRAAVERCIVDLRRRDFGRR